MRLRPLRLFMIVLLVIAIIGVPAALYGFNVMRSRGIADYFAHQKRPANPVTVATAETGSLPHTIPAIGSLQAVHQVTISAEIGGRITQIQFEPGAAVKAGQVLVQLNDGPQRGDLANYEAQAHIAELTLGRSRTLVKRQFESQANVDQNQAMLDQAHAMIAKTTAQVAQLTVKAPFSGVLGVRQIDLGQVVTAGQPLVTLTDVNDLYVNFSIPQQERSRLKPGEPVRVTSDAYPDRSFDAVLSTIEPQLNADTRMIALQATLSNPDKLLLPGMYINASVELPGADQVVLIPDTAVDYSLYGDSVWIVEQDDKAPEKAGDKMGDKPAAPGLKVVQSFVRTGRRFQGKVAVLDGLKPGQQVVTTGQLRLSNGSPVTITTVPSISNPAAIPTE